jgi:CheY-like chemotaxis protein
MSLPINSIGAIEFVSKPIGPFKLAKALRICLEKAKDIRGRRTPGSRALGDRANARADAPSSSPRSPNLNEHGGLAAVGQENIVAGDSKNAQMAIGDSTSEKSSVDTINAGSEFPFPTTSPGEVPRKKDGHGDKSDHRTIKQRLLSDMPKKAERPPLKKSKSESKADLLPTHQRPHLHRHASLGMPAQPEILPATPAEKRPPRILLVEDNKVNLMLLKAVMKKRNYQTVDTAENGQTATEAAERTAYDIIFMDISMPIMNGFEATRSIRDIEARRRSRLSRTLSKNVKKKNLGEVAGTGDYAPALIIALTGLASARDQSEAFTSGVDLFVTKPVSFKEVGRILDNWETSDKNTAGPSSPLAEN